MTTCSNQVPCASSTPVTLLDVDNPARPSVSSTDGTASEYEFLFRDGVVGQKYYLCWAQENEDDSALPLSRAFYFAPLQIIGVSKFPSTPVCTLGVECRVNLEVCDTTCDSTNPQSVMLVEGGDLLACGQSDCAQINGACVTCLLYTSPSPRDS